MVSFFDLFRYFSWKYLDIVQKSIEPRKEWKNLTLILLLFLGACTCVDSSPKTCTLAPFRATSRPYKIKDVWYYPQQHYECEKIGVASWYGGRDGCHTLPTASGRAFDMFALTCAHKTLSLPCVICVTNLKNGRQAVLEVIDRILDVSVAAAKELGFYQEGTATIHIKTLVAESLCPKIKKRLPIKGKKPPLFRQFDNLQERGKALA